MSDELHGHVASIATSYLGGTTTADAAVGATALVVDDVADFAEEGGSLRIQQADGSFLPAVAYTGIDDDTDTVTLASALTFAIPSGSLVRVLDADGNMAAVMEATVIDDADGSSVVIDVAHALIPLLTDAVRAGVNESVVATRDESGEWTVTNVLGQAPQLDAPHAERGRATDLAVPANTNTVLSFDTFPITRGGLFVSNGVWTVPTDGRYLITANVQWEADATGQRRVWFDVNGSPCGGDMRINAAAGLETHMSVAQALWLSDGDEVTVMVSHSSTAATLHVLAGSTVTITGLD